MKYPHLAARVFNTPLMIHPQKLDAILAGLGPRLLDGSALAGLDLKSGLSQVSAGAELLPAEMFTTRNGPRAERGYQVVDGVAVINIRGALVHRTRMEADSSTLLGYNSIAMDIEDAMDNSDVHALLLAWDSPGGEVSGAFELADRIMALRGKKPMVSIADGMAASAAYLGASAADELVLSTTAYAGSIGVVMRHVDFSKALAADGIKVTHIYAGAHKVDGNPYEPLPDAVRADYQAEIDGLMAMFVDTVAAQTGLDPMAIRKTQAATFRGVSAVAAGLASRIGTTDQLITELAALRGRSFPSGQTARANADNKGVPNMSGTTNPGGQQAAQNQPAANTVAPSTPQDLDSARAEGAKQGATAERERVSAILGHEAAAGRNELALECVSAGLSVEQSAKILAASPVTAAAPAAAKGSEFEKHMSALGNPKVTGMDAPSQEGPDMAAVEASWDAAFGIPAGRA